MTKTNPLLIANQKTHAERPWLVDDNAPYVEPTKEEQQKIDEMWEKVFNRSNHGLALVTLLAAQKYESSFNNGRYTLEYSEAAAYFTDDAYEAHLVGMALHGWNDTLDAACKTLGVNVDGNWDEQLKEYGEKHLMTAAQLWYNLGKYNLAKYIIIKIGERYIEQFIDSVTTADILATTQHYEPTRYVPAFIRGGALYLGFYEDPMH